MILRGYQDRDIDALRAAYRAGAVAPLYVLPTGGGKTVVFCYIARGVAQRDAVVWVVCHRKELIVQTSRKLQQFDTPHSVIAPWATPGVELVQVASINTLVRRIRKGTLRRPSMIVLDEGHHAIAGMWRELCDAFPDAKILGVTATPERADGRGLGRASGGIYDAMVCGPSIGELIAEGFLVRPDVYAPPPLVDMTGARKIGGDYSKKELNARMDKAKITGDAVAHYKRVCPGVPTIAFCASVPHAKHVCADFRAAGFRWSLLVGEPYMDDRARAQASRDLESGAIHGVATVDLVSEGYDMPTVVCGIMLRPTESEGLFLQQGGRTLRPMYAEGFDLSTREGRLAAIAASPKPRAIILDHVGNTGVMGVDGKFEPKHGMLDWDRAWSLEGISSGGRRGSGGYRFAPAMVAPCIECTRVYPLTMDTCPACGHQRLGLITKPKVRDAELQQVTADSASQAQHARRKVVGRLRTREELEAYAAAQVPPYKPTWVDHILKARADKEAANAAQRARYGRKR